MQFQIYTYIHTYICITQNKGFYPKSQRLNSFQYFIYSLGKLLGIFTYLTHHHTEIIFEMQFSPGLKGKKKEDNNSDKEIESNMMRQNSVEVFNSSS